jgi:homoserine dehydrogenase
MRPRVNHSLAAVHGAMNAEFIEGDKSGPLILLGQGAGGEPTATAVLGDVLHAVRNRWPVITTCPSRKFGRHQVSIQSMEQSGFGQEARLSFLTHEVLVRRVRDA